MDQIGRAVFPSIIEEWVSNLPAGDQGKAVEGSLDGLFRFGDKNQSG